MNTWVKAVLAGLVGACAFPLVLSSWGSQPLLDGLPREIAMVVCALMLYRLTVAKSSLRRRVWLGGVAGVAHFAVLLYWIDIAMVRFGGMPQWQALPVLALLVGFCAAHWALLAPMVALLRRHVRLPPSILFACAVVVGEWLRSVLLSGFPWGLWGYSQTRNLVVAHLAAFGGVYLVSFFVAWVSAALSEYLAARHTPRAMRAGATLAFGLIAGCGLGWLHMQGVAPDVAEDGRRVAILQGNIAQSIKNRSTHHRAEIIETYLPLAQQAGDAGVQLTVWPEAAWPSPVPLLSNRGRITEISWAPGNHLVGAETYYPNGARHLFNSALWLDDKGTVVDVYHKRHLVPFGEYVPARWLLPVSKLVSGMVDFAPGVRDDPIGPYAVGMLICYDGVFPQLAARSVAAGAKLLVNATNDGWYGTSSGPFQHLDFYVMRAIETERWVVRAANNGISAFITPLGQVQERTALHARTVLLGRPFLRTQRTPYVAAGDWFLAVCLGLFVGALARGLALWAGPRLRAVCRNRSA